MRKPLRACAARRSTVIGGPAAEVVSCVLGGFCKSEIEFDEDVASREARRFLQERNRIR